MKQVIYLIMVAALVCGCKKKETKKNRISGVIHESYERTTDLLNFLNKEDEYQSSEYVRENRTVKFFVQLGIEMISAVKTGIMDVPDIISAKWKAIETADIKRTVHSTKINTQRHPAEPEMAFVQGGTFWMGCSSEQLGSCESDESPLHSVTVSNFKIGKYEVTQAQWKLIMGTTVRQQQAKASGEYLWEEGDNYPMYYVSWNEVQEFITRLNLATGKQYRLPTEAEWEYAARGGNQSKGYKYSGSNFIESVAWFTDKSTGQNDDMNLVGRKQPNELGIYDMSGNVEEWCYDWYDDYSASAQRNPIGASSGSERVIRGGSFIDDAVYCRVSSRNYEPPSYRDDLVGFRLVLPE